MKFALLFALLPILAFSYVEKQSKFDSYFIVEDDVKSVTVKLTHSFQTEDSCNHFGFMGGFREVRPIEGSESIVQDFVADFDVMQTQIGCPPSPEKRTIQLETKTFEIKPVLGKVYANILVPEKFQIQIELNK